MKKIVRILIPIVLVLAIVLCLAWYLFIYDREFTRDVLLHTARFFERHGKHATAASFYDAAYRQAGDNDAVAIELAEQYKESGNYTKAEYTLRNAIEDGGGVELYIALSKTFVEQDKLMDAVNMLNNVVNETVKAQLELLRPTAPTSTPDTSVDGRYYTQYIKVEIASSKGTLYVSTDGEFPSVVDDLYEDGITLTDGENTLWAVSVEENGLVSPAVKFGFVVGGVVKEVSFVDPAVEREIRTLLNVDADKVLLTKDLWTIKEFTVPADAQSFADLQNLALLEKLTVNGCVSGQLSNIAALAELSELSITGTAVTAEELTLIGRLPKLKKLVLNNCSLSTTAGLESAVSLVELDLSENTIRNIDALSNMKKLQKLNLSHNAVNDVTPLATLSTLTVLDVSYNSLTSITPITSLTGLNEVYAGSNTLKNITGFQQLTALTKLNLSYNEIGDISPLSSCTQLTDLDLKNNSLTDISALSGLNLLANLNFANNKVTALPQWSTSCALVNIDGSYNALDTLTPLKGLKHLNNVFMDHNKGITSVKALASCPVLIQVNVFGTGVRDVSSLTSQSVVVNYDPTR